MKRIEFETKLKALLKGGASLTSREVADRIGVTIDSARQWITRFKIEGWILDNGLRPGTNALVYSLKEKAPTVEVVEDAPTSQTKTVEAANLIAFNYKQMGSVRTAIVDGDPWFCLKDVCDVLLINNSRMVSSRLDDDQKGVIQTDTIGGEQNLVYVNESGLYDVILRSDKPEAKPFRKWVTGEVLPSIRKTGSYTVAPEPEKPSLSVYDMISLMAQETQERLKAVEGEINQLKRSKQQAETRLNLLPPANVEAKQKTTRAMILERVATYSRATLLNYEEIHRKLHSEFLYRYHINLKKRFNPEIHKSKLDVVAELGMLEEYYAIACEVLAA
jgi:prophage antirepressor-like protein